VEKGNMVVRGMMVAAAGGRISAPIHSPVSGEVLSLGRRSSSGGFPLNAITIKTDPNLTETCTLDPILEHALSPNVIRYRVAQSGIVGQGGAGFPTAAKLTPPPHHHIDYLILNGCECEPYLTRDYRFMLDRPQDVISGMRLMMTAVGCSRAIIGIEDNKPLAIQAIRNVLGNDPNVKVTVLKTRYPQGAEKMLVYALTGRKVPPGKLPLHVGMVVVNAGTAAAVHDAVFLGLSAITAAITVSGRGIHRPANLLVPVGTPIRAVLDYCGGLTPNAARVISGGPLMGIAQYDLDAPVLKTTSGILILTQQELMHAAETSCLKCGKCVDACPLNLIPTRLVRLVQLGDIDQAENMGITVCMECGTCAYTCPANIPLVQWLRFGKQKISQ
jgi:Na+-translocating ferredoxin:NAD+ oxidoreductase subunit C